MRLADSFPQNANAKLHIKLISTNNNVEIVIFNYVLKGDT